MNIFNTSQVFLCFLCTVACVSSFSGWNKKGSKMRLKSGLQGMITGFRKYGKKLRWPEDAYWNTFKGVGISWVSMKTMTFTLEIPKIVLIGIYVTHKNKCTKRIVVQAISRIINQIMPGLHSR